MFVPAKLFNGLVSANRVHEKTEWLYVIIDMEFLYEVREWEDEMGDEYYSKVIF